MRLITKFDNGLKLYYRDDIDRYCLSDDWLTDWIVFYTDNSTQSFGLDGLFNYTHGITEEIILYLNSIRIRINNRG